MRNVHNPQAKAVKITPAAVAAECCILAQASTSPRPEWHPWRDAMVT